jgi:hypothetical protein
MSFLNPRRLASKTYRFLEPNIFHLTVPYEVGKYGTDARWSNKGMFSLRVVWVIEYTNTP